MIDTEVAVDVVCLQPRWIAQENVIYRLYLNDELLTERNWIWEQNISIREQFTVSLDPNYSNLLKLELIKDRMSLAQFAFNDLVVNSVQKHIPDSKDSISFTVN